MNPLGSLPGSTAPQFSLNALDGKKILRMLLTQAIGLGLTFVPVLMGFKYVYKGVDYTPVVTVVIGTLAETGRRFISGATQEK